MAVSRVINKVIIHVPATSSLFHGPTLREKLHPSFKETLATAKCAQTIFLTSVNERCLINVFRAIIFEEKYVGENGKIGRWLRCLSEV